MNTITSGCGNCMYCYNGQCCYGGQCYGSPQLRYVDGKWCWMPIGSFKEDEEWRAYFWHITAPKLYDKPRELGEFYDGRGRPIKRAFQSWGYCNGEEN